MSEEITKRKLLAAICHGSIFFSATVVSIGIPLAIFFISNDEIAQNNAKEVLNFHLNVWLYGIVFGILTLVLIGWLLLAILGVVTVVMPIIAIIKVLTNPNQVFRYPFIFRLL
ncbi:DUF4870 domain-containing protein [Crocosphaera sp.]|uniref:DUF4870 domain-containing protein n=1 Tax=Crocosphaera sp. TaxID=2729996 RepID=UPI003F1FC497|nr:DUF4870 domain-containing protein [Crocosphaera sp.]